MENIIRKIQVNIPFTMLYESYLELFIRHRLNPEIGLDAEALERFSTADFERIARRLREQGLTVTLHGPFIDLSAGSPDPAVQEVTRHRFEQVLQLIPLFEPRTVVCHAGYDEKRYGYLRQTWLENSLQLWSWMAARLRDAGCRLMLENVYEEGPEDIRIIFEKLEAYNVGFCLDTGHQNAFSKTALEKWLEVLGVHLGQLHLHDNRGSRDDHLALGRGGINFDKLFEHLQARNQPLPVITLEPHREEDFWPSLKFLANSVSYNKYR